MSPSFDCEYSVLLPVYKNDEPEFFSRAIQSMISQTVPFHDAVIVCDGPLNEQLDNCLASWELRLGNRAHVVRLKQNHGLGYALDAGLIRCDCDIVARMDSDDISRADRCERLLLKMNTEGLELVGGAIEEFENEPGDMGSVRMPPLREDDIKRGLKRRNPFNHMSVLFDRRAVIAAGGYEPFPWMEDYWLWARMIANGCYCANIPNIMVDVRAGGAMYARRSNLAYFKSQIKFFNELHHLGLIGRLERVKAIMERAAVTVLPSHLVKIAYNTFLREKKRVPDV